MNPEIKLTILIDNRAPENLVVEHGFAAWITMRDTSILFDTGAGSALLPNAEQLGIKLSQAQKIVLSHGHYDHTGALADVLAMNHHAKLYCGQALALPRFSCHPDKPPRSIGISAPNYRALVDLPVDRIHELHAPHSLMPGVGITGSIPRRCDFEDTGGPFFLDSDKKQVDLIGDDQALWFETSQGLVIAVGCCHAGLVNTVEYVRQITGIARVRGVIGGLHLQNASRNRLKKTLIALLNWKLDFLIPCHCTGDVATEYLKQALGGDIVKPARAGMTFALGELV